MKIKLTSAIDIDNLVKDITFLSKKKRKTLDEQTHLNELLQLHKEYECAGELFQTTDITTTFKIKDFQKVLTPQRLHILNTIKSKHFVSIAELARYTKRDVKNVYDDLRILQRFSLVKLHKNKKNVDITTNIEKIIIEI